MAQTTDVVIIKSGSKSLSNQELEILCKYNFYILVTKITISNNSFEDKIKYTTLILFLYN